MLSKFPLIIMSIFMSSCLNINNISLHSNIPDNEGFAGSLGGVLENNILMIGGANFPNKTRPWNGGEKHWYSHIFEWNPNNDKWINIGNVPEPIGYAAHGIWNNSLVYAGGSNSEGHTKRTYRIFYKDNKISYERLPDLPISIANANGIISENIFYVIGGLEFPDSSNCLNTIYSLDLSNPELGWKELSKMNKNIMLSTSILVDYFIYVISGVELVNDSDGETSRKYLTTCFIYDIKNDSWNEIEPIIEPAVAAFGYYSKSDDEIVIVGGDNGSLAGQSLKESHPGFSVHSQIYNLNNLSWIKENNRLASDVEFIPVTTSIISYNNHYLVLGGEIKPGIRTPKVIKINP